MPRTPYRRHIDDVDSFAIRLRRTRERQGMSQRGLAFPGCSPAYISRIEGGERVPSLHIIRELAARLGVDADWLATGRSSCDGEATEELREALAAYKRAADGSSGREDALERLIRSVDARPVIRFSAEKALHFADMEAPQRTLRTKSLENLNFFVTFLLDCRGWQAAPASL